MTTCFVGGSWGGVALRRNSPRCCVAQPAPTRAPTKVAPLPAVVQENALLETLARRREVGPVLAQLRAMAGAGMGLDRRTLCEVTDMAVSSCGADAIVSIVRLLHGGLPPGYGSVTYGGAPGGVRVPLPGGQRLARYALAAAFFGVLGATVGGELLAPLTHHGAEAHAALLALGCGALYDRYAHGSAATRLLSDSAAQLLADAPLRAARTDAAHFVTGYLLGLPWYALRGQPPRGALGEAAPADILVWLLAGAAAESTLDGGAVVESAPAAAVRYARGLGRAPARARADAEVAYGRACALVVEHQAAVDAVATSMVHGSTAGECLAILIDIFESSASADACHRRQATCT